MPKHKERVGTIERILKENNFEKPKIKAEINKKIKDWAKKKEVGEGYNLAFAGYEYLTYALKHMKHEEGKDAFDKIFFEVFDNDNNVVIKKLTCSFTLEFMGLDDISRYSFTKNLYNAIKEAGKEGYPIGTGRYNKNEFQDKIFHYSKLNMPLLIIGETGTSKGLLAEAIHDMSERRDSDYKEINCAAIPKTLLESELFGHKKGSFTGATKDRVGKIESSDKSTLLLDELGKMPKHLQVKLLKVIEEGKLYPVGSNDPVKINVRFIATLQPDEINKIYRDLLWRFSWPICIEMPTLSDRLKTLGSSVINNSLRRVLTREKIKDFTITDNAYERLINREEYPGNYRELENILLAAIVSAKEDGRDEILPKDIKFKSIANMEKTHQVNDIKLIDIVEYADKEASQLCVSIINEKIDKLKGQGKDIKNTLTSEGLPENKYHTYLKQIRTRTNKKSFKKSKKEATRGRTS